MKLYEGNEDETQQPQNGNGTSSNTGSNTGSNGGSQQSQKKPPKITDIFVLADKKHITKFNDNDGDELFEKYFKKSSKESEIKAKLSDDEGKEKEYVIRKDNDGKYKIYVGTATTESYEIDDKEVIKAVAAKFPKENSLEIRDFADMALKLGQSAALRSVTSMFKDMGQEAIGKVTGGAFGKDTAASIMKKLSKENFNEAYDILFQDHKNITNDVYNDKSPMYVIEYVAMINTAESLHASGKLNDDQYNDYVKKDDSGKYTYDEGIKSGPITKAVYESKVNDYMDKFTSGFEEYQEAFKDPEKAKKLMDPITKQKIEYDTKVTKGMEFAAKGIGALAKGVGGILGITEDAPDIYSKMIFALIGGGKKLWKQYKKDAAIKRFKALKKKTTNNFSKEVNDAIAADGKGGGQAPSQQSK